MTKVRTPIDPGLALLPVRLFLGVTFVYAGLQKLSDPGFFHSGAPSYIGEQLRQFANGTPGGFLLRDLAIPHATVVGGIVALVEICIGLLTLAGLLTRLAAVGGLGLSLTLFLTASWKTYPYFLGSDIVFVFAWLPIALAGAQGQPALDHVLARLERKAPRRRAAGGPPPLTRRALVAQALGLTGVAALALGGLASLARGRYRGTSTLGAVKSPGNTAPSTSTTTPPPAAPQAKPAAKGAAGLPASAVKLGPASQLPAGQAALYTDPGDGQPDIVIRQTDGSLAAHSALCTHAGCQVVYQGGALYCPCHGSLFNAVTGAVEQGPASIALPARRVVESGGDIYAV